MARGGPSSWTRAALVEVMAPIGIAVAAGAAVAATLPPHWRARGAPWVLGYGKNVELAAVACAFVAGAASRWIVATRFGRWAVGIVATIGFGAIVRYADLPIVLSGWPQLVLVLALVTALRVFWPRARAIAPEPHHDVPVWLAVPVVGGFTAAAFVLTIESLEIDVFHHGEVLASALDLLHGGRPFKTFIWPHGLHDTGLAALWILVTGKIGTSPVALARATCRALGIVSTYCLARRLLGSRAEALVACATLALAPGLLADDGWRKAEAFAIHQLGVLVFVVVGFTILTARRPHGELAAGIAFGLAYLFRIESGLFGAAAAVAVLGGRALDDWRTAPGRAARAFGASVVELVLGTVLAVGGVSLVAAWPGREWFAYTLGELPRYHRDAVGIPFPWPVRDWPIVSPTPPQTALAWLVFVLLLLVQAVRTTILRADPDPAARARANQLLFLAVFAALATRSALDRSDAGHVLQWSALPLVGTVMLAVALVCDRLAWSRRDAAIAMLVLLGLLYCGALGAAVPGLHGPRGIIGAAATCRRQLAEHLAPNPPVGACADTTFTPTEAAANRRFIDDTCGVEALLRSHHVTDLVIQHSAPWYYVRFGIRPPTRFFAFARAYTPPREAQLVDDLRARHPQALLRVQGYGAVDEFDVPDALRAPVVDAWIGERRRGVVATPTPLGELLFWNEPAVCAAGGAAGTEPDVGFTAFADRVLYDPTGGILFAQGWAADVAGRAPLQSLACVEPAVAETARLDYGLPRVDIATELHADALRPTGWQLAAPLTPDAWRTLRSRGTLTLRAVMTGGRAARHELDLSTARELGDLDGAGWTSLARRIAWGAALGRTDRAAACGDRADGRVCECR